MLTFQVPEMSCGHCVAAIERAVKALDAHAEVAVDLSARKVTVKTTRDEAAIRRAIDAAGYPAERIAA
ncbi:heavy-metal-associated domain-containing protein [Chelatococcus daeguensis]|uniref:Heavy metal transporter n=2 Tax=Chelatococcus TaxID=28209 RepID=A0AAC9NY55_9HYPH|nr:MULTISPECIES: cation transporter [Chelatococcus]APF36216.1 heavy metal transporter [Chelatococcus daeguensis]KZE30541.1 heavy metal transporter [Chelatococcus daeguensis]MBM3081887.1 heavy-metal-associated domain-containing protein [Chelatococcus daeguensis]CUA89151.1 Copper chaperone CopZ [Chelatococcus sambhunathii]